MLFRPLLVLLKQEFNVVGNKWSSGTDYSTQSSLSTPSLPCHSITCSESPQASRSLLEISLNSCGIMETPTANNSPFWTYFYSTFKDGLPYKHSCAIPVTFSTCQLTKGSGYCQWGWFTDRNVCNIPDDLHLASVISRPPFRINYCVLYPRWWP